MCRSEIGLCVSTPPLPGPCACMLRVHNLLSFPPAINLNKSLQIPLLTLPFCVSACVLQNHNIRENDSVNMSFCRISRCTSILSFLTSHDTLIPSPAPPCTVNTLHCYSLSETMEVGQRAEGCGWMPQHKPVEKSLQSHFPPVLFEKKRVQSLIHLSLHCRLCAFLPNELQRLYVSLMFCKDLWTAKNLYIVSLFL